CCSSSCDSATRAVLRVTSSINSGTRRSTNTVTATVAHAVLVDASRLVELPAISPTKSKANPGAAIISTGPIAAASHTDKPTKDSPNAKVRAKGSRPSRANNATIRLHQIIIGGAIGLTRTMSCNNIQKKKAVHAAATDSPVSKPTLRAINCVEKYKKMADKT